MFSWLENNSLLDMSFGKKTIHYCVMSIGLGNNPLNWSEINSLLDMSIW